MQHLGRGGILPRLEPLSAVYIRAGALFVGRFSRNIVVLAAD